MVTSAPFRVQIPSAIGWVFFFLNGLNGAQKVMETMEATVFTEVSNCMSAYFSGKFVRKCSFYRKRGLFF